MPVEGPILQHARAQIPQTWDALARASVYGPELLQQRADSVKYRLFATLAQAADEGSFYDPVMLDYAGKLTALQVIPAGADYWANQLQSETTSGTNESVTYPDRIAGLWRVHARLLLEVADLKAEFDGVYGRVAARRVSMPNVSTSGPLVTPDPSLIGPLYTTYPASLGLLPWAIAGRGWWT